MSGAEDVSIFWGGGGVGALYSTYCSAGLHLSNYLSTESNDGL